jgi:hypothetical protein
MSKKKGKQRRQQQRQQRRAAKTTQRHRDTGGRKHKAATPYAVEFDQLEAEAIAGMMVGGADEFAQRFGGVLLASDALLDEDEFLDLSVDEETVAAAIAPLSSTLAADDDELETTDDEAMQEILGAMLRHIVQDDGFRADLLSRLDQFAARARSLYSALPVAGRGGCQVPPGTAGRATERPRPEFMQSADAVG